jgi:antitoxin ParD1/3/4
MVQLTRYAAALKHPPLLVVRDTIRFQILTTWTNLETKKYSFELEDLADPEKFKMAGRRISPPRTRRRDCWRSIWSGRRSYNAICKTCVITQEAAMNVSVGKRWEKFIDALVKSGRYASATEVMREGLRLVEEREAKFNSSRETIEASLAEGGENTIAEARARIEMRSAQAGKCAN